MKTYKELNLSMKRICDISVASIALIIFLPVWAVICIAIALEDGRPFIFKQWRLGENKRPIKVIKFRSMHLQKITRVGRWIRLTGLDETLQFLMVLQGKMSVVGPRPLTDEDVCRIGWHDEKYRDRWLIKPGITGLAQLYSGRGARVSMFLDRYYFQYGSLYLDGKIIMLSFLIILIGKKRVKYFLPLNKIPAGRQGNYVGLDISP